MTTPTALVFYENLLPGSRILIRLQDLGYRVLGFHDIYLLEEKAAAEKPMLVLADLDSKKQDVPAAIKKLRDNPATGHIPVLAFAPEDSRELLQKAQEAGATLVAGAGGILDQLPQLLDQALQV